MTWDPVTYPIDYYTIAGQESPGVSILEGAALARGWEKKKGVGTSGATSKYTGTDLASFSIKTLLWLPEHFAAWDTFSQLISREPSGEAKALDIWHPALEDLGIVAVNLSELGQLVPENETGLFSVTVKFDQYREPKPALAVSKGSKAEDKAEPEEDPIDRLIREKTAQYQDLSEQ